MKNHPLIPKSTLILLTIKLFEYFYGCGIFRDALDKVLNSSDLSKADRFEKPSIIIQVPIKDPQ